MCTGCSCGGPEGQLVGQLLAHAHPGVSVSEDVRTLAGLAVNEKGQVEKHPIVEGHHFTAARTE